jgi:hypothetical protein
MRGLYAFLTCLMHAAYAVHLSILIITIFTQKYINVKITYETEYTVEGKQATKVTMSIQWKHNRTLL